MSRTRTVLDRQPSLPGVPLVSLQPVGIRNDVLSHVLLRVCPVVEDTHIKRVHQHFGEF